VQFCSQPYAEINEPGPLSDVFGFEFKKKKKKDCCEKFKRKGKRCKGCPLAGCA
jgi:hypothetical protein